MKPFRRNHGGNERPKTEREVSFEEIVLAIEGDGLLDVLRHHNSGKYSNQRVLVFRVDDYVYLVPFVEDPGRFFLKTIIPSRKATRD
jgi:hypothetical protein